MSEAYDAMNAALEARGCPSGTYYIKGLPFERLPIDFLVNRRVSCEPWLDILLHYAPQLPRTNELEMVVRAMRVKGLKAATPFLIGLFYERPLPYQQLTETAETLVVINDRDSYPAIVEICENPYYGCPRFPFIKRLPRVKHVDVFPLLVKFLDRTFAEAAPPGYGPDLFAYEIAVADASRALAKLGNPAAIPFLERVRNSPPEKVRDLPSNESQAKFAIEQIKKKMNNKS